jgi:hypothetical protein
MGIVLQDGFPGIGAVTNLGGVDADQHLGVMSRAPAFQPLGAYRVVSTTGNIAATLGATSPLWAFQWTQPGPSASVNTVWPSQRLAIVKHVLVSAYVTGTITTAVPFDLELFVCRNGNTLAVLFGNGGTNATPTTAEPVQALRSSMSGWRCAVLYAATNNLGSSNSGSDTNPIGRVQGNSGTAVGTQFFAGRNPQSLYVRDNQDHHPLILSNQTALSSADTLLIQPPFAGPATGTFVVEVDVEWSEVIAY